VLVRKRDALGRYSSVVGVEVSADEKVWALLAGCFDVKKTGGSRTFRACAPNNVLVFCHSCCLCTVLEVAVLANIVIRGHQSIENPLKDIDLETSLFGTADDQFIAKVATNSGETCKLTVTGFEYVTGEDTDGGKIFRKRKYVLKN
jgi:hypothetical protein